MFFARIFLIISALVLVLKRLYELLLLRIGRWEVVLILLKRLRLPVASVCLLLETKVRFVVYRVLIDCG